MPKRGKKLSITLLTYFSLKFSGDPLKASGGPLGVFGKPMI